MRAHFSRLSISFLVFLLFFVVDGRRRRRCGLSLEQRTTNNKKSLQTHTPYLSCLSRKLKNNNNKNKFFVLVGGRGDGVG